LNVLGILALYKAVAKQTQSQMAKIFLNIYPFIGVYEIQVEGPGPPALLGLSP
jgi:hypothetical protein